MKLYLSSYRIPNPDALFELVGKKPIDTKIALIPNAKDNHAGEIRKAKVDDMLRYMSDLAIKTDVVDLRDLNSEQESYDAFKDYDLIWAQGGNTFCLRYEMRRSGFDKIVHRLVSEGVVYGGDSAGSVVAGPDINGIESGDDPNAAKEVISDGLGLTDKFILPHCDSIDFGDAVKSIRISRKSKGDIIELNDNQAYLVDGDTKKIITS